MNKQNRDFFYRVVGVLVYERRTEKGLTYAQLEKLVGEQNITIRKIEEGSRCSLHHLLWMMSGLDITVDDIFKKAKELKINGGYTNGKESKIRRLDDLI